MYAELIHNEDRIRTDKPTRATEDPLVMLEMLVAKCLGAAMGSAPKRHKASSQHRMPPLKTFSIFRDQLKSEEICLRFDLLTLDERCIRLPHPEQSSLLSRWPFTYLEEHFGVVYGLGICFLQMLLNLDEGGGFNGFYELCLKVKRTLTTEGDMEYKQALSRCFVHYNEKF